MKTLLLLVIILLASCEEPELHRYSVDPPTEHADYLTYVKFQKAIEIDGKWETDIYYSWEVLQYNPNHRNIGGWNTLHFEQSPYSRVKMNWAILYWWELPPDPIGTSFESTSGTIGPPSK